MITLKGIIPIMQAPFTDTGEVDYESLASLTNACIEDGVGGLALFGIATEFYKLSGEERVKMTETVVKAAAGRVPVIASVTRNSTELAVKEARAYEAAGADAVMTFSPHVVPTPTNLLIEHFITIAKSISLPYVIQYSPTFAGGVLTPESICAIADAIGKPLFIKAEPLPAAPFVEALRKASNGKIGMFAGNMGMYMIDLMDRGVTAIMPGCSTIRAYARLYKEYAAGNREKAQRLYETMLPYITEINAPGGENFLKLEKVLLKRRGIIKTDYVRKPACLSLDQKTIDYLIEVRERVLSAMDCRD